ncbi:MAG: DUF2064 domain-containing protein [Emcibacter sp.]|nr:DUF2064 domain-containing protein [Emcibacter sp.]
MSDKGACLVVFCKRPALNQGKQRLAATIGAEQAFVFAQAFLDCALDDARIWPGSVVLSPASVEDEAWAAGLLDHSHQAHQVIVQPEGNLGHRLWTVDRALRELGQDRIIFMGSDAPMLTACHFGAAAQALEDSDVVLSPATDGGVTLMGTRIGWPDLTDLPWSTDQLGAALENLCRARGDHVKNILPSYDVDVVADLAILWRDLSGDPRFARKKLYKLLDQFLTEQGAQFG